VGLCSIWTLWLWPTADSGSHRRFMSTNATQWWSDETPQGWWRCSQLAENHGGNSIHQLEWTYQCNYNDCKYSTGQEFTEQATYSTSCSWVRQSSTQQTVANVRRRWESISLASLAWDRWHSICVSVFTPPTYMTDNRITHTDTHRVITHNIRRQAAVSSTTCRHPDIYIFSVLHGMHH